MAFELLLMNHKREFDGLIEDLMIMEYVMKSENLMIIYVNSLSAEYNT